MPYTPTELNMMSYRDFHTVVEDESKSQVDPDTAQAIRDPTVLRRWYEVLVGLQKSVEGQLAAMGAEGRARTAKFQAKLLQIDGRFTGATLPEALKERQSQIRKARQDQAEAEAELERWRTSAIRWKTGNEDRLTEAKFLLRSEGDDFFMDRTVEERNRAMARVLELEAALRQWRDSFTPEDELSPEDLELMKHVG